MNKWNVLMMLVLTIAITALGVTACVWLARLLAPSLLMQADSTWLLPSALMLSLLSTVLLLFALRRRRTP